MEEEFLSPENRAQDIILGSIGIVGEARIVALEATIGGYRGVAEFGDGERICFESDNELNDLQRWALAYNDKQTRRTPTLRMCA